MQSQVNSTSASLESEDDFYSGCQHVSHQLVIITVQVVLELLSPGVSYCIYLF